MSNNVLADIDEVQELGETALTTLTQLWRQLPRLDSEAGKSLGDKVVEARKAIERLVRIGCEAHTVPHRDALAESTKLYAPLPFGAEHARPHQRPESPQRSDSSVGNSPHRRRPSFPIGSPGGGGDGSHSSFRRRPADGGGDSPNDELGATAEGPGSAAYDAVPPDDIVMRDYEKFKRELNLPAGLNWYDDPGWAEMMNSYQRMSLPPSRLSLMVQLAQRREFMWRLHARMLQCQSDRDALAELETKGRADISVESSEARETLLAKIQGVHFDESESMDGKKAQIFSNIKSTFERDKERAEVQQKMDQLQEEKRRLVAEMSKLSGEVTKLSREHANLTKRAASPSQTIPPDQLSSLIREVSNLRKQVDLQEEELKAMGV